jgi:hypothetical protein
MVSLEGDGFVALIFLQLHQGQIGSGDHPYLSFALATRSFRTLVFLSSLFFPFFSTNSISRIHTFLFPNAIR